MPDDFLTLMKNRYKETAAKLAENAEQSPKDTNIAARVTKVNAILTEIDNELERRKQPSSATVPAATVFSVLPAVPAPATPAANPAATPAANPAASPAANPAAPEADIKDINGFQLFVGDIVKLADSAKLSNRQRRRESGCLGKNETGFITKIDLNDKTVSVKCIEKRILEYMRSSKWYKPNNLEFVSRPNTLSTAPAAPANPAATRRIRFANENGNPLHTQRTYKRNDNNNNNIQRQINELFENAPAAPATPPPPSTQIIPKLAGYCGIKGGGVNSCYMNSAIQFLYSMDPFRHMINSLNLGIIDNLNLHDKCREITEKKNGLRAFKSLFDKFNQKTGETIHKNEEYKDLLAIGRYHNSNGVVESFKVNNQEDAAEFIIKITDLIECFKEHPIVETCYNSLKFYTDVVVNCVNEPRVRRRGKKDIKMNFDLEIKTNTASIQGCIDGFLEEQEFKNNSESMLKICGNGNDNKGKAISRKETLEIPNELTTLIVKLNRFDHDYNKITQPILIDNIIKIDNNYFRLKGCIIHTGETLHKGHYVFGVFNEAGQLTKVVNDSDIETDGELEKYLGKIRRYERYNIYKNGYVFLYEKAPNTPNVNSNSNNSNTNNEEDENSNASSQQSNNSNASNQESGVINNTIYEEPTNEKKLSNLLENFKKIKNILDEYKNKDLPQEEASNLKSNFKLIESKFINSLKSVKNLNLSGNSRILRELDENEKYIEKNNPLYNPLFNTGIYRNLGNLIRTRKRIRQGLNPLYTRRRANWREGTPRLT